MNLSNALSDWYLRAGEADKRNVALLGTLPENPERGSYDWWARVCRENTGQALCDSGLAYGYGYNRVIPPEKSDPITIEFDGGEFSGATIELIHWLTQILDAGDETAEALEKVLHWCGTWLHPEESWARCISEFGSDLDLVMGGEDAVRSFIEGVVYPHTHLQRFQSTMTVEEYIETAMEEFPRDAVRELLESNPLIDGSGGNTYNNENDLSQAFQWTQIEDDYGDTYVILQTHTGCDIRGGYTAPVVALVRDQDYFHSWNVDFWCQRCDGQWEMPYFFSEALTGSEPKINCDFALEVLAFESGAQSTIPGMEPEWPESGASIQDTLLFVELWRDVPENEREAPDALISMEDGEDVAPEDSHYGAASVRLRCPECGAYAVHASNNVAYGF